ncbi:MAG: hypothetical protein J5685_09795 [Clostridiales bacterium]|nr:hypothetical protein [Clostridiales bacterium]
MYLKMLKRDLKDKIGLNIVLFFFMITASAFMVIGTTLIYSMLFFGESTYKACNTADILAIMDIDRSDAEGLRSRFESSVSEYPIVTDINRREVVMIAGHNVKVIGGNVKENIRLRFVDMIVTAMPEETDIPYDLNDERFEVPNGCIAIPQNLANRTGAVVGDSFRLTTQMGNIYEFTVSTIYKDPSALQYSFLILSDRDTETFYNECPMKSDFYEIFMDVGDGDYITELTDMGTKTMFQYKDYNIRANAGKILFLSDEGVFALIMSFTMTLISFFLMVMVMITIDFSLKSALKREEREIGMMKAIGVWSFSYKSLFIVKYIAFAIAGGLIGLPVGFFLTRLLFIKFIIHIIFPPMSAIIMISVFAVLVTVLFMIGFSFLALIKINRISVIDVIHGENRGERFSKLPGLRLSRTKHMSIPVFLALSDILRGIKRYIYLILAFVLGMSMVLLIVQVKSSLLSEHYIKRYFQRGDTMFLATINDEYWERLYQAGGDVLGAYEILNREFADGGVPAEITILQRGDGTLAYNGHEIMCNMEWCSSPSSEFTYLPGGNPPVLKNEIAISYYYADRLGISIGDTVTVTYDTYEDDRIATSEVSEDFMITAYIDGMGTSTCIIIMGDEFEGAVLTNWDIFSDVLDVPEDQYREYYNKLQSLYTPDQIRFYDRTEAPSALLPGFEELLDLMILVVSVVTALILILLTALYENIFIEEETADIALLKSLGFRTFTIRMWHFARLLILAVASLILAHILVSTGGAAIVDFIYTSLCRVYGFDLLADPVQVYLIIPVCFIAGLATVIFLITGLTKNIQIWKVRNE